jgi:alcohol dehydrogenase YqhD (iron-dependent ADH family)
LGSVLDRQRLVRILNEHDIDNSAAAKVEEQLEKNGFLKFGEHGDITPYKAAQIIAASV